MVVPDQSALMPELPVSSAWSEIVRYSTLHSVIVAEVAYTA